MLSGFIRGIGQDDFARNFDPGVGTYVDGGYLARTAGSNVGLLDVERIEILKGPQGTPFGRNTIGGAISVVTRKPTDDFSVMGQVSGGRFNRIDVGGVINIPIVEGKLKSSIAFSRSEEHTSELQSLMRISYAVFCLKKKKNKTKSQITETKHHRN